VTLNIFSEEDTIKLIKHPFQMVGSDSIPAGEPHPRLYGNYPLFIGKFVREKKAISLEEAIYKSTLLPAKTLGLKDIGEIKEGKRADITIFDFNEITGYEDYNNKTRKPIGIKHVIVNGNIAMEDEVISNGAYGQILKI
jgi:N-acyl-D-amino-acid deacylase